MPSFAVCSATASSARQQDAVVNTASSGHDDRAGLVILLQPHLGSASSRAREFAVTRSDLARAVVPSAVPLVFAQVLKPTVGGLDFQRAASSLCTTVFPSNTPNEPTGFHTSSPRWKAPAPLLFALCAATLSLAFVIEIVATAFGRRQIGRCYLGENSCRL
jgi:hypothetical protein